MTVTPKQLREAADTLDALYVETGKTSYCSSVTRGLREMADERDTPVDTVRQVIDRSGSNTYIKVGPDRWYALYRSNGGDVTGSSYVTDAVAEFHPIVHKPS